MHGYEICMHILPALFAAASLITVQNAQARPQYTSAAPIAYMVDMTTGAVLYDKSSMRKIPPASMAKMMTTYVIFDLISQGKLKPEQKFAVRPQAWKAWNNTGSTMFLKPNELVSLDDLLHGMVTLSGNDAAVVLAEGISGDEKSFVKLMNATAMRLGMNNSRFGNANGWPDEGQTFTTAHDLALLGMRTIQDFPTLYSQYYSLPEYRWNNITQPNRNPILKKIPGADGVKTGHSNEAGYCFTGTAEQNGRRILMVVAGLNSPEDRLSESVRFLHWGFNAWRTQPLFKAHSKIASLPVQMGNESRVSVIAPHALSLVLPAKDAPRYKLVVRYNGPVRAPFKKGTELAKLVAKFSDGSEQTLPLVAAVSVAKANFLGRAWNGAKLLVGL